MAYLAIILQRYSIHFNPFAIGLSLSREASPPPPPKAEQSTGINRGKERIFGFFY